MGKLKDVFVDWGQNLLIAMEARLILKLCFRICRSTSVRGIANFDHKTDICLNF